MNALAALLDARAQLDAAILASIRVRGESYIVQVGADLGLEGRACERLRTRLSALERRGALTSRLAPPSANKSGLGRRYYRLTEGSAQS